MDLQTLLETRLLVQANSGGGKSWCIRRVLEQTHNHVQHIILDLEGEFSTLREKYDYLLVGKDGDIPISIKTAELLAKKILELNVSVIIDLYELKQHERILFVKRFLDSLINAPKELWHYVLVVIDEAHVFCPEHGKSESSGSVIDLQTRGRKRGLCGVLATQRLSKLNKDAAAECNNKLIGRTGLDVDMKRASEELGFTSKQQMLELRDLESGNFFGFGSAISKSIIQLKIGEVATSHPKVGSRSIKEIPPASSAVQKILLNLKDLPQQADEELKTVQDYQRKVRELQNELRSKPKPQIDEHSIAKAKEQGFKEAEIRYNGHFKEIKQQVEGFKTIITKLGKGLKGIAETANNLIPSDMQIEIKELPKHTYVISQKEKSIEKIGSVNFDPEGVSAPQLKILQSLARFRLIGRDKVIRSTLAAFSGVSSKSSGYKANLSSLNMNGFIVNSPLGVSITENGLHLTGDVDAPSGDEELQQSWYNVLSQPQARILQKLVHIFPQSISKDDLAVSLDVSSLSSGYKANISNLKVLGAIETLPENQVKATKELFLQ